MTFTTKRLVETEDEERARLADAPAGTKNHELSWLPVNIHEPHLRGLLIKLPDLPFIGTTTPEYTVVVVPVEYRFRIMRADEQMYRRHDGSWECIVVASNHPAFPVDGYRTVEIPTAELVRGERFEIPL